MPGSSAPDVPELPNFANTTLNLPGGFNTSEPAHEEEVPAFSPEPAPPVQPENQNETDSANATPNAGCDDGNPCTTDSLDGTVCVYEPINCNDGNVSTQDSCQEGVCTYKIISSGNGDESSGSNITGNTSIIIENNSTDLSAARSNTHHHNCDDDNPCTEDTFNGKECEHKSMNCDDGDNNTYDYCYKGKCYNTATKCDDGNACTEDSFDGVKCVNTTKNCDDGNACNGVEKCNPATGCVAGKPLKCDDGNPCTDDICDRHRGCLYPSKCDDHNPCTVDRCGPWGCTHTQVVCSNGRTCMDGFCQYPYYPYYYYYPFEIPFFPPASSSPASSTATPRYYILPAGTSVALPWGQYVTAVESLQVHNDLALPGSSPISFTKNIIRPISVGFARQSTLAGLDQAEMIGLTWKNSGFNLTLIQPNGITLPIQGDGQNVVHLTGPKYDYYFLRSPAPGNWIIRVTPISPASGGADYSLIYGKVRGTIPQQPAPIQ